MWKIFWFMLFSVLLALCCSGICLGWSTFIVMALLVCCLISEAILLVVVDCDL
nr:MAG TPA: hypothetical protein [Bacteriophage sp.]